MMPRSSSPRSLRRPAPRLFADYRPLAASGHISQGGGGETLEVSVKVKAEA